jgi:hypothetical protein
MVVQTSGIAFTPVNCSLISVIFGWTALRPIPRSSQEAMTGLTSLSAGIGEKAKQVLACRRRAGAGPQIAKGAGGDAGTQRLVKVNAP